MPNLFFTSIVDQRDEAKKDAKNELYLLKVI